jgi:hypothetical protein
MQNISLYIPHVFSNYTRGDVAYQFERLDIGEIDRIDFVSKIGSNNVPYNTAYIHFKYWNDNEAARNLQERVLNPNREARLMYDDPWYWIVLENKAKKFVPGDRKKRISLEEIFKTPNKEPEVEAAPLAPTKMTRISTSQTNIMPLNLQEAFEATSESEMDEIEALMDEEDGHLITIDGRYVEELENELAMARRQLMMMTAWNLSSYNY